jgi:hypothetical protein
MTERQHDLAAIYWCADQIFKTLGARQNLAAFLVFKVNSYGWHTDFERWPERTPRSLAKMI